MVPVRLGADAQFLDLNRLLSFSGFALLLSALVDALAVIDDSTDRRLRVRRNLDEIQVAVLREAQRFERRHHADLLPGIVDDPDLFCPNGLIDPKNVAD